MAYTNRNLIKLYYQNVEVGIVWDAHTGLGWTSGRFRFETSNESIRNFLIQYKTLEDVYGDELEEALIALRETYGDMVESQLWKLVEQGTRKEINIVFIPFINEEQNSITYKVNSEII